MVGLLVPLADGAFAQTSLSDGLLIAAAAIALAMQGFPPILPCLAVTGARDTCANVHSVRVGGVLEGRHLVGTQGSFR